MYCLSPPMKETPPGEWICPLCPTDPPVPGPPYPPALAGQFEMVVEAANARSSSIPSSSTPAPGQPHGPGPLQGLPVPLVPIAPFSAAEEQQHSPVPPALTPPTEIVPVKPRRGRPPGTGKKAKLEALRRADADALSSAEARGSPYVQAKEEVDSDRMEGVQEGSSSLSARRTSAHAGSTRVRRVSKKVLEYMDDAEDEDEDAEGEEEEDEEVMQTPARGRKRKGVGSSPVVGRPPLPRVRLRLPSQQHSPQKGKGKERAEEEDGVEKGMFDDILDEADRDTSKTQITKYDLGLFERSRQLAEVRLQLHV